MLKNRVVLKKNTYFMGKEKEVVGVQSQTHNALRKPLLRVSWITSCYT